MSKNVYVKKIDAWSIRFLVEPASIPITELCARIRWISPNGVTLASFIVTLLAAYLYCYGPWKCWAAGAVVWQFAYILDGVDGKLARKLNRTSQFGAQLDGWLDKVKKVLSFAALVYSSPQSPGLLAGLIVVHYLLQRAPYRDNPRIREFLNKHSTLQLFDPLDGLFFIFVLGPLLGHFYEFLLLTIACQIGQILSHVLLNRAMTRENNLRG